LLIDDSDTNMRRTPLFFVDEQIHSGGVFKLQNTPIESDGASTANILDKAGIDYKNEIQLD